MAAQRNRYLACRNQKVNRPQHTGDLAWNKANGRNRRSFNDRTGLPFKF